MRLSTVSAILTWIGLGRPPGVVVRIDVEKLGRINGAATASPATAGQLDAGEALDDGLGHVHVAVGDATWPAYVEVPEDENAQTAVGFLHRALALLRSRGIRGEHVMTDEGPAFRSVLRAHEL